MSCATVWRPPAKPDPNSIYEESRARYACHHRDRRLTVKVAVNGSRSYKYRCFDCGKLTENVPSQSLSASEKSRAVEFDESIPQRWYEAQAGAYQQVRDEIESAYRKKWDRWYAAYLASPEWRARRAAVLKRDGYTCQGCLARPATQVHHKTYDHVGAELLFDLVSVCDECHEAIHPGMTNQG